MLTWLMCQCLTYINKSIMLSKQDLLMSTAIYSKCCMAQRKLQGKDYTLWFCTDCLPISYSLWCLCLPIVDSNVLAMSCTVSSNFNTLTQIICMQLRMRHGDLLQQTQMSTQVASTLTRMIQCQTYPALASLLKEPANQQPLSSTHLRGTAGKYQYGQGPSWGSLLYKCSSSITKQHKRETGQQHKLNLGHTTYIDVSSEHEPTCTTGSRHEASCSMPAAFRFMPSGMKAACSLPVSPS